MEKKVNVKKKRKEKINDAIFIFNYYYLEKDLAKRVTIQTEN